MVLPTGTEAMRQVRQQRPELFAATLPAVGVLDMLRYHTASANARQWSSDFGLSEVEDEYHALRAYSPVHNVEAGTCYPPTLITTADHDDRVVPWNSFKWAAEMQHAQGCDNPILLRVETRAGHGAGKPRWMIIEGLAYILGNDVDTDQIIPAEHLVYSLTDPEEKKNYGKINSIIEVQGQATSVLSGAFAAILITGVNQEFLANIGLENIIPSKSSLIPSANNFFLVLGWVEKTIGNSYLLCSLIRISIKALSLSGVSTFSSR